MKRENKIGYRQFEKPLIMVTLWLMVLSFFLALTINIFVQGYNPVLNYIFITGLIITAVLFYLFRFDRHFNSLKIILIVIIWGVFNVSWFFNHGFNRTVIILFAFFFTFIIFVQNNRGIFICSLLMAVNIAALFLIESLWPGLIEGDITPEQNRIDIFYTLFIGWILIPAYIYIAKTRYLKEYSKARKSEELKSAFLANMSHEIRTPLNAIMGFSELLQDEEDFKTNRQYVNHIFTNSEYLFDLIDNIMNLSLIQTENFQPFMQVFSLKDLFDRLRSEAQVGMAKLSVCSVLITLDLPDPQLEIRTDRTRLEQILKNLIANAIKFTNEGEIKFGVTYRGNQYQFYVQDTGTGISPENLTTIFDRFVKLDNADQKHLHGAGLGLHLSDQIVKQLGGTIWVESTKNLGSTFYFTLPGPKPVTPHLPQ